MFESRRAHSRSLELRPFADRPGLSSGALMLDAWVDPACRGALSYGTWTYAAFHSISSASGKWTGLLRDADESAPVRVLAWPAFSACAENPYTCSLYSPMGDLGVEVDEFTQTRLLRGDYDVWHLHWPDGLLSKPRAGPVAAKVGVLMALLDVARMRGIKRVWTIHNLQSHEGFHPAIERRFWSGFLKRLDGYISLSEEVRAAAVARFPGLAPLPSFLIPLGSSRGLYPDQATRAQARNRLGLPDNATVLAHVGQIRRYKSVPHLIRTFRSMSGERPAVLLVAGKPHPASIVPEVQAAAGNDQRVRLSLDFVPDEHIQLYLRSADLVVLPYSEIANSGSAMLSLSFDCPTLVPKKGAMPDLQKRVGEDWVRLYDGELTREILVDAIKWAGETPRPTRAPLDELGWPHIARQTVDAYRQICAVS